MKGVRRVFFMRMGFDALCFVKIGLGVECYVDVFQITMMHIFE